MQEGVAVVELMALVEFPVGEAKGHGIRPVERVGVDDRAAFNCQSPVRVGHQEMMHPVEIQVVVMGQSGGGQYVDQGGDELLGAGDFGGEPQFVTVVGNIFCVGILRAVVYLEPHGAYCCCCCRCRNCSSSGLRLRISRGSRI